MGCARFRLKAGTRGAGAISEGFSSIMAKKANSAKIEEIDSLIPDGRRENGGIRAKLAKYFLQFRRKRRYQGKRGNRFAYFGPTVADDGQQRECERV
jgi:hypothetical protein